MEQIGLHNYEAWLLDYSENKLSDEQKAELATFLVMHPELDVDLDTLSLTYLEPATDFFPNHSALHKELSPNEEATLQYLENNLSAAEKTVFELRLKHEVELRRLLEAYSKTIVLADEITFAAKSELLKTEEFVGTWPTELLYVEQQLTTADANAFEIALKANSTLQKETALYMATKVTADMEIVHPNKAELLRQPKVIALFSFQYVRVAAAILLLTFFAFLVPYLSTEKAAPTTLSTSAGLASVKNNPSLLPSQANKVNTPASTAAKQNASHGPIKLNTNVASTSYSGAVTPSQIVESPVVNEAIEPQLAQRLAPAQEMSSAAPTENTAVSADNGNYFASVNDLEIGDDFSALDAPDKKGALWHKAVELARKVNKMGFTAVNGTEEVRGGQRFTLSFNSISVEKK